MTVAGRNTRFSLQCGVIVELLMKNKDQLDAGEETALAAALTSVRDELPSLLSGRMPAGHEPQDVAQDAIAKFLQAVGEGRVDPAGSPAGYLLRIAANLVRDSLRKGPVPDPYPDLDLSYGRPGTDEDTDRLARLIDTLASAERVRAAIARAVVRGDTIAVEVVQAWLDQASVLGGEPPSRAVAEAVGVSKTTVANALQRFRAYLKDSE